MLTSTLPYIRKPLNGGLSLPSPPKYSALPEKQEFLRTLPQKTAQEHSKIVHSQQIPSVSWNVGVPWNAISAICHRLDEIK